MYKAFLPMLFRNRKSLLLPLGTAFHMGHQLEVNYYPLTKQYFQILTPEAEGCYYWVQVYGRDYMDDMVTFAKENNKKIHYAHLRWWYPNTLTQPADPMAWIEETMLRYPTIIDWTVCNEAWCGEAPTISLIEESYVKAREVRPDARLFYNGLLFDPIEQRKCIELIEKGLVDCVGIQMHNNANTNYDVYKPFLYWLKSRSIPWRISEMDVEIPSGDLIYLTIQAMQYRTAMNLALEYGAEDFGVWGVADNWSWLQDHPLLFDKDGNRKPSYYALLGKE